MASVLDHFNFEVTTEDPQLLPHETPVLPAYDETIISSIEDACAHGELSIVKTKVELLRRSWAGDLVVSYLGRALRLAASNRHASAVAYLLDQGVPVNSSHVQSATEERNTDVLALYFSGHWDINEKIGWAVPPALAYAVDDAALTEWFLSRGADPNAQCLLDITPLSAAVQYAPISVIKLLFEHGGSIAFGQLLNYAAWRELDDRVEVVEFLLAKGAPINNIMYQNRLDCYRQREAFALGTALHDAAAVGSIDVVKTLVDAGAELCIKDSRGETPLQRAERNHHFDVIQYLRPRMEKSAQPSRQFTDEMSQSSSLLTT